MGEVQLREGLLYGRRLQYSEGLLYGACCWSTDGDLGAVRVSIMELAAGERGGDGWMGGWVGGLIPRYSEGLHNGACCWGMGRGWMVSLCKIQLTSI